MTFIDLFSGIGGFALGAKWAGIQWDKCYHSDIDDYANKVYAKHFPESIQLGDITQIDTSKIEGNDFIVTGGSPCQDISIAGKGAGLDGKRSGLWFEMWRVIRDLRPRFAIMENVPALTYRGLNRVLGSLAEIGYDAEWQTISAAEMGAWHKRERIWIIAYPQRERGTCGMLYDRNILQTLFGEASNTSQPDCTGQKDNEKNDPYSNSKRCKRRSLSKQSASQHCSTMCEVQWETEPDVGRVVDGLSNRSHRLRCLGNSIVPQIAYLLFNQIKPYLQRYQNIG